MAPRREVDIWTARRGHDAAVVAVHRVARSVGGNVRLIEDGVTGLLVPSGDPDRLAKAVGRLLDDPALARRLGAAARQRAEERYSRGAMVRRFEEFYLTLAGGQRRDH